MKFKVIIQVGKLWKMSFTINSCHFLSKVAVVYYNLFKWLVRIYFFLHICSLLHCLVVWHELSFSLNLKLDYILCCFSIARKGSWKHHFSVHGKWEKACERFYSPSKRKIRCMFLFNTNFCGPTFCLSTDCRLWCKWVSA